MALSRRSKQLITGALLLLFAPPGLTQGIDEIELGAMLEESRQRMKMPGLRAAIRYSDGKLVRAAVGVADKETGLPMDNVIGMPGGSTGKTFVAALTLLLVQDGTLALDELVKNHLGDERWFMRLPNAETMQVQHLLSHSSGLRDYLSSPRFHFAMIWRVIRNGSARFEPEELIGFARTRNAPFAAGEGFRYTDAGYLVLGRMLESASSTEYYDLLNERILAPLQLQEIRPQDSSVLTGIATGYTGGTSNLRKDGRMKFDPSSEWTGGGLITTPTMLVEFFGALAEGRIVTPQNLERMVEGGWQDPRTPSIRYGFGMFVYGNGESFGHGGLWPGYRTHVAHFRNTRLTVAVQTNRDGRVDLETLTAQLASAAAVSIDTQR